MANGLDWELSVHAHEAVKGPIFRDNAFLPLIQWENPDNSAKTSTKNWTSTIHFLLWRNFLGTEDKMVMCTTVVYKKQNLTALFRKQAQSPKDVQRWTNIALKGSTVPQDNNRKRGGMNSYKNSKERRNLVSNMYIHYHHWVLHHHGLKGSHTKRKTYPKTRIKKKARLK